jgi:HEAT repeat protein
MVTEQRLILAGISLVGCICCLSSVVAGEALKLTRDTAYWRGAQEKTPGAYLCRRPDITNLVVSCDRWPDCSDLRRFGLDAIRLSGAKTRHQEALAIWQWIRRVKISTNGQAPTDPFNLERDGGQANDAIKVLNVYGGHWCSGLGRITASVWRALGREGQALHRYSHGMGALFYRDQDKVYRSHLFDCNFGGYTLDRKKTRVLGPDDFSTDWYQWMYPWYYGETWPMPTHRVELSLRKGEKLQRIWGNWGKPFHDNINKECLNPPRSERGPYTPVYGNGRWSYSPDLTGPTWSNGLAAPQQGLAAGKLMPAAAGKTGIAIWHFRTPYITVESAVNLKAFRKTENDVLALSLSVDNGKTWKECWRAPADQTGQRDFLVKLDQKFKVVPRKWKVPKDFNSPFGRYAYRLKLEITAAGQPEDCRVESIDFQSLVQQNIFALPQLQPGRNKISVRGNLAQGAALQITYLWDDPAGQDRKNVTVLEKLPHTYEIIAAGKQWKDCRCKSINVEVIAASGQGNRISVKEKVVEVAEHPPVAPASESRLRWMRKLHGKKSPSVQEVNSWIALPGKAKKGLIWASELQSPKNFEAVRKAAFNVELCKTKLIKELALLALYNTDRQKARPLLLTIAADLEFKTGWRRDPKNPNTVEGAWMSGVCIIGQMAAQAGWKEFVPALVKALESKHCGDRNRMSILRSLISLAEPGDAVVVAAVRKSLAMEYAYMLTEAAELAGKIKDKGSIPRLRELLDHPFLVVRRRAAVALGRLGDTASAPKLRKSLFGIRKPEVLDHTKWGTTILFDENMRAAAARGLGEMGDGGSRPALEKALQGEPVPWVRLEIEAALHKIKAGKTSK